MSVIAGFGGIGGGGGKGKDAVTAYPSTKSTSPVGGNGGGGGGGGRADKLPSSTSDFDDEAAPLDDAADNGILGPIDDLNMGGFPGGGAPVGFSVG